MREKKIFFDCSPPTFWGELCFNNSSLFHSPDWHVVLENGFGATPLFVWDELESIAFSIIVFKAGPFRVGYLGFPSGGTLGRPLTQTDIKMLNQARLPIDLLRIPVSGFGPPLETEIDSIAVPETAVCKLLEWQLSALPKLKRDLRKARHTQFSISELNSTDLSATVYDLYRSTVLAKGGNLKYTAEYFHALIELSLHSNNIRCIAAFYEQELCGFVVTVLEAGTGYYLHGATSSVWKSAGVSDLLVYDSLEWAQRQGAFSFNLMSSPVSQPGLIRYKEKFGATTRAHLTYEISLSYFRAGMLKAALQLKEQLQRLRSTRI